MVWYGKVWYDRGRAAPPARACGAGPPPPLACTHKWRLDPEAVACQCAPNKGHNAARKSQIECNGAQLHHSVHSGATQCAHTTVSTAAQSAERRKGSPAASATAISSSTVATTRTVPSGEATTCWVHVASTPSASVVRVSKLSIASSSRRPVQPSADAGKAGEVVGTAAMVMSRGALTASAAVSN
jgi:hypothetical protein